MKIKKKILTFLFPIAILAGSCAFADADLSNYDKAREGCSKSKYCEEMSVVSKSYWPVLYKVTCNSIDQITGQKKQLLPDYYDVGVTTYLVSDEIDGHQWGFPVGPGNETEANKKKYADPQTAIDTYCPSIFTK